MEHSVLIGLAAALVFFVWIWIGLTIVQRMSLERKIEKLENIENRLPEEQRSLDHFSELRAIEKNKIASAKFTLVVFGLLLLAGLGLGTFNARIQAIFGFDNLKVFSYFDIVALAFIVMPTFVGLTLAGGGRRNAPVRRKAKDAEEKGAAS